jgi:hypothetical protein
MRWERIFIIMLFPFVEYSCIEWSSLLMLWLIFSLVLSVSSDSATLVRQQCKRFEVSFWQSFYVS